MSSFPCPPSSSPIVAPRKLGIFSLKHEEPLEKDVLALGGTQVKEKARLDDKTKIAMQRVSNPADRKTIVKLDLRILEEIPWFLLQRVRGAGVVEDGDTHDATTTAITTFRRMLSSESRRFNYAPETIEC